MLVPELPVAARTVSTGIRILGKFWAALTKKRQELAHASVFREALGIGLAEAYSYRVGMNHPLYNVGTPHPDDFEAFVSVLGTDTRAWSQAITWVAEEDCIGHLADGFVLIGSPEAEAITRLTFGYHKAGRSRGMKHIGIGVKLPFRWEEDGDIIRATHRKYVPGLGLVQRPNWPILDQRGTAVKSMFPRVGRDGMLLSDLLLITKVPNYLTLESYQSGRAIVSVAGTHGTGTRAIGLLLRNRKQMAEIGAEIEKNYQSFQVLLEVTDICHDPERGSQARRVAVHEIAHLDYPDRVWAAARRAVVKRYSAWRDEVSGLREG